MSRTIAPVSVLSLAAVAVIAGTVVATPALAAGEASSTSVTATAVDPNDALLTSAKMPVVNQVQNWRRVPVRHTRVSKAQPAPLKELGFQTKARRDFALPGAQATNVVLTFAEVDQASAAYAEIKSWRQHTGDNVPAAGALLYTSTNMPVDVEKGRGSRFAFVFKGDKAAEDGTFEWLGVTRRGAAVSVVAWRVGGTDATFEVDPTIASVKAANVALGPLG